MWLFVLLFAAIAVQGYPEWENFTCGTKVKAIAFAGDTAWIGTEGGLAAQVAGSSTIYTKSNSGLPVNDITSILAGQNKVIWVGTAGGGLVKISGAAWEAFTTLNSQMPGDVVQALATDGSKLYVGTDKGIGVLSGSQWTHYNTSNSGLTDDNIQALVVDKTGKLWVATSGIGILTFDGNGFTEFSAITSMLINDTKALAVDSAGTVWFGTNSGGVFKYDGANSQQYNKANTGNGIPHNGIQSIACGTGGIVWVGTQGGASKYNGATWQAYTLPNNNVKAMGISPAGTVTAGTISGAYELSGTSTWNLLNTSRDGLPDNEILSLAVDSAGALWAGTGTGGLAGYNGTSWNVYNSANSGLHSNKVNALVVWGNALYAAFGSGHTDGDVIKVQSGAVTPLRSGGCYSSLFLDNHQELWVGVQETALLHYTGVAWDSLVRADSSYPYLAGPIAMAQDGNGVYWLSIANRYGGTGSGLASLDRTSGNTFTLFTPGNSGLPETWINAIWFDPDGKMWIGTGVHGLAMRQGAGSWTSYTAAPGALPSNQVTAIQRDAEGRLWLGTANGLARFDGTAGWQVYTVLNSGLPSNRILSLFIDKNDTKWIGTDRGVAVCSACDLVNVGIEREAKALPHAAFDLRVYPTPSNCGGVRIGFTLDGPAHVQADILDVRGKMVRRFFSGRREAGAFQVSWNAEDVHGSSVPAGIYFVRLTTGHGKRSLTKRIILTR